MSTSQGLSTRPATRQYELFIDGEFVPNSSGRVIPVVNPATEEVISETPAAGAAEVDAAVHAARRAQAAWSKLPAIKRAGHLREIAAGIRRHKAELARVISEEQGKILPLAEVEVDFSADYLDYNAEWARRYEGEIIQSDRPNENILLFKAPLGVVAGILPWNFPFFLIVRKLAPALVTGNTIVIKPSHDTPNNAFEFAQIVAETTLPKGVFNLVSGTGSEVGGALCGHPMVDMVSLTGSVSAGTAVMQAAAKNITKVSLELGGKAPAIVMADADLDLAVNAIHASRVINSGQVCNCAERVYVHESVAKEFTAKICARMAATKVGDPFSPGVEMGPLVSKDHRQKVAESVQRAQDEGAKLALGGNGKQNGKGFYYPPTVLTGCAQKSSAMQEEIFGPVLPIATFQTMDEAIESANDCEMGLTSSIYTSNIDIAMRACNELKFGETYINRENFEAMQGFHAGWRRSGIGGADGKHGLEEYLQTHVVYLQYDQRRN